MKALSTAEKAALLRDVPIFASVPPRDLTMLASMMETEEFRPGDVVCAAGDPADTVHVIVFGSLSVRVPGRADPVGTMGPGEIFGELAMFARSPRSATVTAVAGTTVLSLGHGPFREFLLRFPEATLAVLETVVRRFLAREREAAAKR